MDTPRVSRHYMTGLWTWDCTRCGTRGQDADREMADLDAQTHPCGVPPGWTPYEIRFLRDHVVCP